MISRGSRNLNQVGSHVDHCSLTRSIVRRMGPKIYSSLTLTCRDKTLFFIVGALHLIRETWTPCDTNGLNEKKGIVEVVKSRIRLFPDYLGYSRRAFQNSPRGFYTTVHRKPNRNRMRKKITLRKTFGY